MPNWKTPFKKIEIGKGRIVAEGEEVAILSIGHIGNYVVEASKMLALDEINPAHYDMRFTKPLDEELLHVIFQQYKKIITVEDGTVVGGFGSAILEFMALHNYTAELRMLGIPDGIVEHGSLKQLHAECGFDAAGIANTIREMMKDSVKIELFQ